MQVITISEMMEDIKMPFPETILCWFPWWMAIIFYQAHKKQRVMQNSEKLPKPRSCSEQNKVSGRVFGVK